MKIPVKVKIDGVKELDKYEYNLKLEESDNMRRQDGCRTVSAFWREPIEKHRWEEMYYTGWSR